MHDSQRCVNMSFVLDGHPIYKFSFVGLDEFHKVVGPFLVVFGQNEPPRSMFLLVFIKASGLHGLA